MIQLIYKSFGRIRVRTLKLRGGMEFTGTVTGIKFRNEENGWTVLRIKGDDGEELTAVGVMPSVNDGEHVTVTGNMTAHPMYGEQIRVTSYKMIYRLRPKLFALILRAALLRVSARRPQGCLWISSARKLSKLLRPNR